MKSRRSLTLNPFKSAAQRRACYAAHDPDWDCSEWEDATPKGRKLPERITKNARLAKVNPLKLDPSRTLTLRKALARELTQRFRRLKLRIFDLVVRQDAFGLAGHPSLSLTGNAHLAGVSLLADPRTLSWEERNGITANDNPRGCNQYTGPGCSAAMTQDPLPRSVRAASDLAAKIVAKGKAILDAVTGIPGVRQVKDVMTRVAAGMHQMLSDRYGPRTAFAIVASAQGLAWGATAVGAVTGVPIWLPGSSIWGSLPAMALAETVLQAHRAVKAVTGNADRKGVHHHDPLMDDDEWETIHGDLSEREVEREAHGLLAGLRRALAKHLPKEVVNAFCPTGEGGGQDNSCSPQGHTALTGKDAMEHPVVGRFVELVEEGRLDDGDPRVSEILTAVSDEHRKLVSVRGGELVGAVSYQQDTAKMATIHQLGSMGKGAGGELVKDLQGKYSALIAKTVKDEARPFYKKMGFENIGNGDNMMWTADALKAVINCAPGQMRGADGRCGPGISLGFRRDDMPQVRGEDLPHLLDWLAVQGVAWHRAEAPAGTLSPVQSQFRQDRVDVLPEEALDQPVLVSSDDYVLDGTHRWVRHWQRHPESLVPIIHIDLPVREAIDRLSDYPRATFTANANPEGCNQYKACGGGRQEQPASMDEASRKFNEVGDSLASGRSSRNGPEMRVISLPGGRYINVTLKRHWPDEGPITYHARVDFGIEGEGAKHSAPSLKAGSVDFMRTVKQVAQAYHQAGFKLEVGASDERRRDFYHKALSGMGMRLETKAEHGGPDVWNVSLTANAPPTSGRWSSLSPSEKVKRFRSWLDDAVDEEILGTSEHDLFARHARQGFAKGAGRAFDDTNRRATAKAMTAPADPTGLSPDPLSMLAGGKEQFLKTAFAQPVAGDKIRLLADRAYADLEGVTEQMATSMTRGLMDGLAQGKSPLAVAKDLDRDVEGIGIARATTIARTEVVRAHADGQLLALQQIGVKELGVDVEWTATDGACDECSANDGVVFTLEEAQGLIPHHPNCRCCWVPAFDDLDEIPTKNVATLPMIQVPDRRQKGDYDCGAAVAHSIIDHFHPGNGLSEQDIIAQMGTSKAKGTSPDQIRQWLAAQGIGTDRRRGMAVTSAGASDSARTSLTSATARGWPVLVPCQMHGDGSPVSADESGHWVVVVGVRGGRVHFQDPMAGKRSMPAEEFDRRWHDVEADGTRSDHLGIVVMGTEARNAFCPTGPGGGIDATCSPSSSFDRKALSKELGTRSAQEIRRLQQRMRLPQTGQKRHLLDDMEAQGIHRLPEEGQAPVHHFPAAASRPPQPSAPSPSPLTLRDKVAAIAAAFHGHEGVRSNLVGLADLKDASGLSISDLHEGVQHLRREGILSTSALEGRHGTSAREREAAIFDPSLGGGSSGGHLGYVSVREGMEDHFKRLAGGKT